jgi:energy-coupling factor transporter transmembrane protein EcfT
MRTLGNPLSAKTINRQSKIVNQIMHFDAFDRYHETESFLHRLDPRVKVVATLAFILSNALLPDGAWIAFGISWLFLLFANWLSNLGIGFTFRRSLVALPFALIAITVLFAMPGKPLFTFHFYLGLTIQMWASCVL